MERPLDFEELESRLLRHLRDRIRCGELTERRLALVCGISQPHIHNVLRGKRSLSMQTADRILHVLRIDLRDFMEAEQRPEVWD